MCGIISLVLLYTFSNNKDSGNLKRGQMNYFKLISDEKTTIRDILLGFNWVSSSNEKLQHTQGTRFPWSEVNQ